MSMFVIIFAVVVFGFFISSVVFLGWAILLKIPKSYKGKSFFTLINKDFLSSISEEDKSSLTYVRKSFFSVLLSFVFLAVFIVFMKMTSLYLT